MISFKAKVLGIVLVLLVWAPPVLAEGPLPQDIITQVRFEQKLDAQVPANLSFTDSTGKAVTLGDYFGDKPIILDLGYYECPMLCSLVRNGLFESLKQLDFTVGQDFTVLIVSIDPGETPDIAEVKRRASMMDYGRSTSTDGWNFLVGPEDSIKQLADTVGFKYVYDAEIDQYAHPSGVVILTPEGRVSRYFYGIEFPPTTLRLGLVEAAANKIGSPVDQLLLACYHYDPVSGEYTLAIMNIIRIIGVATVALVGGAVFFMVRRDSRKSSPRPV